MLGMGKIDIIYGTIMMILSIVFFIMTFSFPQESSGINPRAFPRFVIISTFILSGILIVQGFLRIKKDRTEEKKPPLSRKTILRIAALAIGGMVYTLLVGRIGYVIATPLLIALTMVLFEERRWLRVVTVSVLTTVIMYYLFRGIFRVPLPRSIFW